MKVLIIDFESTGRDPKTERIIEVGAILYDPVERESVTEISHLIWERGYPNLSPEIEKITGISGSQLQSEGEPPHQILDKLVKTIENVNYVVAYNTSFDREILFHELARHQMSMPKTQWICGMRDLPVPQAIAGKRLKLSYMALEHGITVDPTKLHRAMADTRLLAEIIKTYDFKAVEKYYKEPSVKVIADVDYDTRELAKARGFQWDGKTYNPLRGKDGIWWKKVKLSDMEALADACDFKLHEIEEDVP